MKPPRRVQVGPHCYRVRFDASGALGDAGMPTVASCCGHGRRPSTVALADGREVIVARTFEEARTITAGFPDINARGAET